MRLAPPDYSFYRPVVDMLFNHLSIMWLTAPGTIIGVCTGCIAGGLLGLKYEISIAILSYMQCNNTVKVPK